MTYLSDYPSLKQVFEQEDYWLRKNLLGLTEDDKKNLLKAFLLDFPSRETGIDVTKLDLDLMIDGKSDTLSIVWKNYQWEIEELHDQFLLTLPDYDGYKSL